MARARRVHHAGLDDGCSEIVLEPGEAHHVARVLRLRVGDAVAVFDGKGREWVGEIAAVSGESVRLRVGTEVAGRTDPTLPVALYQALCRPERMEWVVQKAVEVGVSAVRPVRTERVEVPPPSAGRIERWRRIALEACKQSGRRVIPAISEASEIPPRPAEGTLALLLDSGPASIPLGDYLTRPRPGEVWLAVGPEGGFSPAEVEAWDAAGWRRAGLGPRVLRTETAGLVASTLVLHAWDDLGRAR